MAVPSVTPLADQDRVRLPPDLLADRLLALAVPCPYCRALPGTPCSVADVYDERRETRLLHPGRALLAKRSQATVQSSNSAAGPDGSGRRPRSRPGAMSSARGCLRGIDAGTRPLLYLDVDGPLFPAAASQRPAGYHTFRIPARVGTGAQSGSGNVRRVWLRPEHGRQLRVLAGVYDMVWATAWLDEANQWIRPVLGVPRLPVLHWTDIRDTPTTHALLPKTRAVIQHAGPRPFAWVDARLDDAVRQYAEHHATAAVFLHQVDPKRGLTEVPGSLRTVTPHRVA